MAEEITERLARLELEKSALKSRLNTLEIDLRKSIKLSQLNAEHVVLLVANTIILARSAGMDAVADVLAKAGSTNPKNEEIWLKTIT